MKILETPRTILRTFETSDLERLAELHFDEKVMRFLGGGVRTQLSDVQVDLDKYIEHQQKHGFSKWAIIHKDTNAFMGRAGLIQVPHSEEIDLGYALHQKYWRQGYGTEISQGLFEVGLKKTGISNIVGIVVPGNEASVRVLEKTGFSYKGTGHYFGLDVDVYRPHVTFQIAGGPKAEELVNEFYVRAGRKSKMVSGDLILTAQFAGSIIGAVRLCLEQGVFVLRTMQVASQFQARGLGRQMLKEFENLLQEKQIRETFCFCYSHLEKFYGQIGFKKILPEKAPLFLQERMKEGREKNPNLSYILMVRN